MWQRACWRRAPLVVTGPTAVAVPWRRTATGGGKSGSASAAAAAVSTSADARRGGRRPVSVGGGGAWSGVSSCYRCCCCCAGSCVVGRCIERAAVSSLPVFSTMGDPRADRHHHHRGSTHSHNGAVVETAAAAAATSPHMSAYSSSYGLSSSLAGARAVVRTRARTAAAVVVAAAAPLPCRRVPAVLLCPQQQQQREPQQYPLSNAFTPPSRFPSSSIRLKSHRNHLLPVACTPLTTPHRSCSSLCSSSMAADPKAAAAAAAEQLKAVVGLDDKNAKDLSTKPERVEDVLAFFAKHKIAAESPREHKVMLFSVWTKVKSPKHRDVVAVYVTNGKLDSTQKADAAIRFVNAIKNAEEDVNTADLEKECGVGVTVSEADARAMVTEALKTENPKDLKASWDKNPNMLLGKMRRVEGLRWADVAHIKAALDATVPNMVKDVVVEAAEKKAAAPPAASEDGAAKKEVKKCPVSEDFAGIALGLPATPIGQLPLLKEGTTVYVRGWAHRVRHQSRMSFVVLRDATGYVQCVFDGETDEFHRETSLAIRGTLRVEPKAKADLQPGIELHVEEYSIIGKSDGTIETIITPESSVDKLLDQRHIVLRGTYGASTLKVRHEVLRAFREFFWSKNYYEVTPPTLVQTQCEGGSTLFDVLYYGEKAYMTQSSQLYLETVTASLGNVYCCMPSYRAEKSKTKRHLSEYTHLEVEYDICTFEDLLSNLEDMICHVFQTAINRCGDLIAFLNPKQLIDPNGDPRDPANYKFMPKKPFRRLPYADAIKFCNENGILNPETGKDFVFGEDITDQPERAMVAKFGEFILMTHFPVEMKSFYMMRDPANPTLTESVDVLAPGIGEIVGGSMRMWDYDELLQGYRRENLDPSVYYWYTDQRRYGSTPHGGFGLGVERFLVWLLDLDSVKEACMFPRYMGRCKP